jgi:hypothetical protein
MGLIMSIVERLKQIRKYDKIKSENFLLIKSTRDTLNVFRSANKDFAERYPIA